MLHLKSFTFNPFQQNTFVLFDDEKQAFIIDAGNSTASENAELQHFIEENALVPGRLLLTHAHIDHVMGNRFIHDTYGLLPEVHNSELFFLEQMETTARMYGLSCDPSPMPEKFLEDGNTLKLGKYEFECILAPGHSPGSICFYNQTSQLLIGGDVLFSGSIGRTDLPMGNHEQLLSSIHTRILTLPADTRVYCGHGPSTTVGRELQENPFLV